MTTNKEENMEIIREAFLGLCENFIARGNTLESLEGAVQTTSELFKTKKRLTGFASPYSIKMIIAIVIIPICLVTIGKFGVFDNVANYAYETRCLVPNNYFVWEFTRPVSRCDFCRNVSEVLVFKNLSKSEFEPYAYSSRPMIVKEAARHWPAGKIFNINFFRNIYDSVEGAYESIDEECQFLQFKSNFGKLREVLEMDDKRALNLEGEDSWYVGWKNCHPGVLEMTNRFYDPPHFLPNDAEIPATNYIFLGYEQGAIMHLDYIPRLMWQGQIVGSKTWTVAPTPECENVCKSFNFTVDTGDIVLLDTRVWYHGTYVKNGRFSLTITSEYG